MKLVDEAIAEQVFKFLQELGYAWVGENRYICSENPREKRKRFKMYQMMRSYIYVTIRFWNGTGHGVLCDDYSYPLEDLTDAVDSNTQGKYVSISIANAFVESDETRSDEKQIEYILMMDDREKVLAIPEFKRYRERFSNLTELEQRLHGIMDRFSSNSSD